MSAATALAGGASGCKGVLPLTPVGTDPDVWTEVRRVVFVGPPKNDNRLFIRHVPMLGLDPGLPGARIWRRHMSVSECAHQLGWAKR